MHLIAGVLGLPLLLAAVSDAFQTVVVARHVRRLPAITRIFYHVTWVPYAAIARLVRSEQRRDKYLGIYGPLSLDSELAMLRRVLLTTSISAPVRFLPWVLANRRHSHQST